METTELLLAALATTSLALLFLNLHGLRRISTLGRELREERQRTDQGMQKLYRGSQALQSQVRQDIRDFDARLEHLTRRQQDLESRDIGSTAYSHAGQLSEMGAASDELVKNCGLSAAEARLVAMMHPRRNDAAY